MVNLASRRCYRGRNAFWVSGGQLVDRGVGERYYRAGALSCKDGSRSDRFSPPPGICDEIMSFRRVKISVN